LIALIQETALMKTRPTIIDVAECAGVSKTTVSRVVNGELDKVTEETVQKVQAAIRKLGYVQNTIASSLRTDRTNIVMLMIPDITNPFWPDVARGIQDVMGRQGYSVVFGNSDWSGEREVDFLRTARRNRIGGILINPIKVTEAELLESQIPAVVIGNREGYPNLDMVGSDSYTATQKALEYLFRLGHRRIGLLLGQSVVSSTQLRLDSFHHFFEKSGMPLDPELVLQVPFDHAGGMNGMRQLLDLSTPPTAVLGANDLIAIGAMHAAVEMGYRVPDNISIMGIDDIYVSSLMIPALTTMRKQKYELGQQSARLLLERMNGVAVAEARKIRLACQLVVRGSTAPLA